MTYRGLFIGVGKYSDSEIPDLTGAPRDARALHALFADTFGNDHSTLLVESDATLSAVQQALSDINNSTESDDMLVVFFSGHGSHNHRLAVHDTELRDLDSTTISMNAIADLFKRSKAHVVLCILDCCFSGGAPAKVLESSPIPKASLTPLDAIAGEGRLLLSACGTDESAYESPLTGHGILTKALLDLFFSQKEGVELLAAMATILATVRAEAAKMGIVQTPNLLGSIQGGLAFPALSPGDIYKKAFPEYAGVAIGPLIHELAALGLPQPILDAWAERYPAGLNDLQLSAVNDHRITHGESLAVVAPTSSGKTFIGEMAAAKAVADGRKAIFLFPYKALVNEKYDQFEALYSGKLGLRVIRCTGDYHDSARLFIRGKYNLAVLTYEMFLQLVVSFPGVRNQLGLVVIDEAQFITDPTRGINVELLLTFLLAGRELGTCPQLIALSAVIGNANAFHDWLGCGLLRTDKRPIPLIEGVIDRDGILQYLDLDGSTKYEQAIPQHEIVVRRDKASAQDVIVPLVRKLVGAGEQIIVFRNKRGPAQGCAAYLATELGLPPASAVIERLPTSDPSSASSALRTCLTGGTAFHTTNLNRDERVIVEQAFRGPENGVRVLAATTTVAAGINTPASTVILAEQEFVGEDGRPFTVAEYKNMAGRAGRLGFQEQGKSIIYAETSSERDQLFRQYVLGPLESLRSSFDADHFETWILRLLAQVPVIPRDEVVRLLANTYAGYTENLRDPSWRARTIKAIEGLLDRMLALTLLESEGDRVRLTLLGRACGRSALSFDSALRLIEMIRALPPALVTAPNLLAVVQVLKEGDAYTPMLSGNREAVRVTEAIGRYGQPAISILQRYAESAQDYWARCKRASVLYDWISGIKIELIESRFSTTPYRSRIELGDIQRFTESTRFILRSAAEIVLLILPSAELPAKLDEILTQLETGIPAEALGLLDLGVPLARGQYLDLYSANIRTQEAVWEASPERLKALLPSQTVERIERLRPTRSHGAALLI
jgi:helicase